MTLNDRIAIIRNFVPRLREKISNLSDTQLTTPYIQGEWTVAQNVHHLLDAHINAYLLCNRILTEDNAGLSWPLQDAIAELPGGQSPDLEPSLIGLEGLHERWANTFSNVTDWTRAGTSLKSGKTYTIEKMVEIYANHCENHLRQIQDVLDAM